MDVIVLVRSVGRERVDEGEEPGTQPCDGSPLLGPGMDLQHRGGRGEERKHTALRWNKGLKVCEDYTQRNCSVCALEKQTEGSLLNRGRLCTAASHLLVPAAKNRQFTRVGTAPKNGGAVDIYRCTGILQEALCTKTPLCVSMLCMSES